MSEGRNNVVALRRERPIRRKNLEPLIGYRRAAIQTFIAEGMPTAGKDNAGRNLFYPSQVKAWLATRNMHPGLAKTRERGIA